MSTLQTTIFSPATAARFDRLVTLYPMKRSALCSHAGFMRRMRLAAHFGCGDCGKIRAAHRDHGSLDVRSVLSYYSMLRTKPAGKYNVQVCTNISCMLRDGYGRIPGNTLQEAARHRGNKWE